MTRYLTFVLPLALMACDDARPTESACTPVKLALKMEKYAASSARLTGQAVGAETPESAAGLQAFASRIAEKSAEISRELRSPDDSTRYMNELCRTYDELQAIVDEAAAGGLAPAENQKSEGQASSGNPG